MCICLVSWPDSTISTLQLLYGSPLGSGWGFSVGDSQSTEGGSQLPDNVLYFMCSGWGLGGVDGSLNEV